MTQDKQKKKMKHAASDGKKGSSFRIIPQHLSGLWHHMFFSLVTLILYLACSFLSPQVLAFVIDKVIGGEDYSSMPTFVVSAIEAVGGIPSLRENLLLCSMLVVVFALVSGVAYYAYMVEMGKAAEGMVKNLRDHLYDHIQKLPFAWHASHPTGDIIQRSTSDVEVVRGFVSNQVMQLLRTVVMLVISLILMFRMSWKLALISAVFVPIIAGYSGGFSQIISKRFRSADEAEGDLSAMVQENLTGVRVVRAFGREAYEMEKFDRKNNEFANRWINLGYMMGTYWGVGDLACGMMNMLVLTVGTYICVTGQITVGELLVFISYNGMLNWPIRQLGRIVSDMSKTGVSLKRVGEIFDAEEEQDDPDALTPDLHGEIVFDHVSFKYPEEETAVEENRPVLHDISFAVKPGMTVGILGSTGSGKSTLMYLLDRLYELKEGNITIGGVDIRRIKASYLRQNIGFVLQEPFLFSKTILENIAITKDDEKKQLLEYARAASRTAAVDHSITEFKEGYDTVVGERGVTLSGGQKQRVAIARMLMQKANIMIFDDSLSAVDTETDLAIRKALKTDTQNATVFLISHRITTIMDADYVLVLEDGRMVQQGTPDELAKTEGIYKTIYDMQSSLQTEADIVTKEVAEHGV